MKKHSILLLAAFVLLAALYTAHGQGCSDAGFCTMHGLEPNSEDDTTSRDNQLALGVSNGRADYDIAVWNISLEYSRHISKEVNLAAKLSYAYLNGPLAQPSNLADVYVGGSYKASDDALITLGLKLPLHDGNAMNNELPLPMDYQPGLGTTDIIAAIAYDIAGTQVTIAVQQPLSQNSNTFLATAYPADSEFRQFQSTNAYTRKGDVLLRVSYPIHITDELVLTPSLLPIYHIANDTFTDTSGAKRTIDGSQGLTLNGTVVANYTLDETNALLLSFGMPFATRTARPDGLARGYVAAMEYRIAF